jgi:hypothetical protein
MNGPKVLPESIARVPLASHQSLSGLAIYQAIGDSSGASIAAGSYVLQKIIFTVSFTLNISLQ